MGSAPLRGQHDLDGAVLPLLEDLVAERRLLQRQPVGGEILGAQRIGIVGDGASGR